MIHEHMMEVIPCQGNLPAHLDQRSGEGWELVSINVVAVSTGSILGPQGPQQAAGYHLVFRRPKSETAEAIDSIKQAAVASMPAGLVKK